MLPCTSLPVHIWCTYSYVPAAERPTDEQTMPVCTPPCRARLSSRGRVNHGGLQASARALPKERSTQGAHHKKVEIMVESSYTPGPAWQHAWAGSRRAASVITPFTRSVYAGSCGMAGPGALEAVAGDVPPHEKH